MTLLGLVTWPDVALSAIPTIAAVASAYIAYLVKRDVRTQSGKSIGHQVEDAHHTVISNNQKLDALDVKIDRNGV